MNQFGLSRRQLDALFEKLLDRGRLEPSDLEGREAGVFEATVEMAGSCPYCGAPKLGPSETCPECGFEWKKKPVMPASDSDVSSVEAQLSARIDEKMGTKDSLDVDPTLTISQVDLNFGGGPTPPPPVGGDETTSVEAMLSARIDETVGTTDSTVADDSPGSVSYARPPEDEPPPADTAHIDESYSGLIPSADPNEPQPWDFLVKPKEEKPKPPEIPPLSEIGEALEAAGAREKKKGRKTKASGSRFKRIGLLAAVLVFVAMISLGAVGVMTGDLEVPEGLWPFGAERTKRVASASLPHKRVPARTSAASSDPSPLKMSPKETKPFQPIQKETEPLPAPTPEQTRSPLDKPTDASATELHTTAVSEPEEVSKPPVEAEPTSLPSPPAIRQTTSQEAPKLETESKLTITADTKTVSSEAKPEEPSDTTFPLRPSAETMKPARAEPIGPEDESTSGRDPDSSLPVPESSSNTTTPETESTPEHNGGPASSIAAESKEQPEPTESILPPTPKQPKIDLEKPPRVARLKPRSEPSVKRNDVSVTGPIDTEHRPETPASDTSTSQSETARLLAAVRGNDVLSVKKMIDRGADVNAAGPDGELPLAAAVMTGDLDMIKVMVASGAVVDARDDEGNTALMLAAGKGDIKIIEYLLTQGADPNLKNQKGINALGWAYSPRYPSSVSLKVRRRVVRLLKQFGSVPTGALLIQR
jgi:hypothetical protein